MAKRGVNTGNGQKYIAIYEHENSDIQRTAAYKNAIETEWTRRIRPYLRNLEKNVYTDPAEGTLCRSNDGNIKK